MLCSAFSLFVCLNDSASEEFYSLDMYFAYTLYDDERLEKLHIFNIYYLNIISHLHLTRCQHYSAFREALTLNDLLLLLLLDNTR